MSTATVLDSSGGGFEITNSVLNSSGTAFLVDAYALDSDGNSFLIFLSTVIPQLTPVGGGDGGVAERLKEDEKLLMMIIKAYMKHTI